MLPLHEPRNGEEYLLGMFLGGVYQEVMGSNHNMLGTTHAVHVRSDPNSLPSRGEPFSNHFSWPCILPFHLPIIALGSSQQ